MLIVGATRTLFDPEEGILGAVCLAATYLLLKPKGKTAPAAAMTS